MDLTQADTEREAQINRERTMLEQAQTRDVSAELRTRLSGLTARIEQLTREDGTGFVEGQWFGIPRATRERVRRLEALNDALAVAVKMSERLLAAA